MLDVIVRRDSKLNACAEVTFFNVSSDFQILEDFVNSGKIIIEQKHDKETRTFSIKVFSLCPNFASYIPSICNLPNASHRFFFS